MNEKITKQIDQQIDKELKKIDNEVQTEEEIKNLAFETAGKLLEKNKIIFELDDRLYKVQYNLIPTLEKNKRYDKNKKEFIEYMKNVDTLNMVFIDISKFKISSGKYGIFKARSIFDRNLTTLENLKISIEAFIKHTKGIVDASSME